jgi:hypothetical protein
MKRFSILRTVLACLLCCFLLLSGGCGQMLSQSIKTGVFSYISGSVADTFQSRQFTSFLNDLLTGGGLTGGNARPGF